MTGTFQRLEAISVQEQEKKHQFRNVARYSVSIDNYTAIN